MLYGSYNMNHIDLMESIPVLTQTVTLVQKFYQK